jgi:hypothetical protein
MREHGDPRRRHPSPSCLSDEFSLGGALADPVDASVLIYQGASREEAERFVARDPYVRNGLMKSCSIRPWATVVGDLAQAPVRP